MNECTKEQLLKYKTDVYCILNHTKKIVVHNIFAQHNKNIELQEVHKVIWKAIAHLQDANERLAKEITKFMKE